MSNTPLVKISGRGSAPARIAATHSRRVRILDSKRAGMLSMFIWRSRNAKLTRLGRRQAFQEVFAVAVPVLHRRDGAIHQQRHIMPNARPDFTFPVFIEAALVVEPVFQPARRGQL